MPSDYKQCKLCGKIYKNAGSFFCPNCARDVDKHFRTVKDFIYKNPNVTVTELVDGTEIDERIILYFLREGRLEMMDAGEFLKCDTCGAPITTGRICSKCAEGLSAAFDRVIQKPASQSQKSAEASASRKYSNIENKNRR
jgi:uncharacterized protein